MFKMIQVPFYHHAAEYWRIKPEIDAVVARVLDSGTYLPGKEVAAFEEEFAAYCGRKHCVSTGSCYDAMFRSLVALGIGSGDEVITVSNTDIASSAAIHHAGASVVWTDIDERTFTMDPSKIEGKISPRTKALLVVHMYGHPADMDPIMEIARRHHLFVIEDAAIAPGADYKGKKAGTIGHVGCFSHSPSKVLGTLGDGGGVLTDDSEVAEKLRRLFIYSGEQRYIHVGDQRIHGGFHFTTEGYHGRLSEMGAAVLRVKLKHLDDWISRRREVAEEYRNLLGGMNIILPFESKDVKHVYRNYTIRVKERDEVRVKLAEKGVGTGIHYAPPLHLQPVYSHLPGHKKGSLPITEIVSSELVTLPIYPELTREQIQWVAVALEESIRETVASERKTG